MYAEVAGCMRVDGVPPDDRRKRESRRRKKTRSWIAAFGRDEGGGVAAAPVTSSALSTESLGEISPDCKAAREDPAKQCLHRKPGRVGDSQDVRHSVHFSRVPRPDVGI
jgi:hypothetical protein